MVLTIPQENNDSKQSVGGPTPVAVYIPDVDEFREATAFFAAQATAGDMTRDFGEEVLAFATFNTNNLDFQP